MRFVFLASVHNTEAFAKKVISRHKPTHRFQKSQQPNKQKPALADVKFLAVESQKNVHKQNKNQKIVFWNLSTSLTNLARQILAVIINFELRFKFRAEIWARLTTLIEFWLLLTTVADAPFNVEVSCKPKNRSRRRRILGLSAWP